METLIQHLSEAIAAAKKNAFSEPQYAFEMAEKALKTARENNLRVEEAAALFVMALACRSMTDLNRCYNYTMDAYHIYEEENNETGLSATLNLFGVIYFYYANYERATEYFMKALSLAAKLDDQIIVSRIYNNMGEIYREVGNYTEALLAYEKALQICEKYSFEANIPVILENIGDIYLNQQDYDSSYEYFKRSFDLLLTMDDLTTLSEVETKLGRIHFIREEYHKSKTCYDNALHRLEKMENKYFILEVLINLAEYELMQGNEDEFMHYLNQGVRYGEEIHAVKKLSQIYKMITEFYENKNLYELALNYYKRYHHMEQAVETTIISKRLEIIKIEINKTLDGEEIEKMMMLNRQLEREIASQGRLLKNLEVANKNLTDEVLLDELTQISSRRGVKQYLEEVFEKKQTRKVMGCLLMLDIDHFKKYNDTFGHIEGDKCLKKIGEKLNEVMGSHKGILGRYGGEEFVCFVKKLHQKEAEAFAEEMRKGIESLGITYEWQGKQQTVTISIGVVYGNLSVFGTIQQMYILADEQLYKAKDDGRNCVKFKVVES